MTGGTRLTERLMRLAFEQGDRVFRDQGITRNLPGTHQPVLWACHFFPDIADEDLLQRTGYSVSQVRRLRRELREANLLTSPVRKDADLSEDQRVLLNDLLAMGLDHEASRRIVQRYPLSLVRWCIKRTRAQDRDRLYNQAGFLVALIRRTYRLDTGIWGTPGQLDGPDYATPTRWAHNTERSRRGYLKHTR